MLKKVLLESGKPLKPHCARSTPNTLPGYAHPRRDLVAAFIILDLAQPDWRRSELDGRSDAVFVAVKIDHRHGAGILPAQIISA